jgi:ribose transport system ATP-binding protein
LLDEPTSALTPNEIETLFRLLRRVRAAKVAIVYVSHQMREVFAIADRITVMRDGRRIGTWRLAETEASEIVRRMVGRDIVDAQRGGATIGDERFAVESLSASGHFHDVSFVVRAGEIVGLAGLMGSGRGELARALGGARKVDRGRIRVDRRLVSLRGVHDALGSGVAYIPGDRKTEGLFLTKSVADNIVAPSLARVTRFGVVDRVKCNSMARETMRKLRIRAAGPRQPVERLSGGNQQKVLLGKWLTTDPRVLIVDEPTKGVDVAAKNEIHQELRGVAARGAALVIVSSDLPELLALCDRILVMREGALRADIPRREANEEMVMAQAAGLNAQAELAS